MIFQPIVFMEDSPSSGSVSRGRKASTRKTSSDEAAAKPTSKRRTRQETAEEAISAHPEIAAPVESQPRAQSNSETTLTQLESQAMNQTHDESQWQPQMHQDFQGNEGNYSPDGFVQDGEGYYEEDGYAGQEAAGQFGHNQIVLTLSYSLMNQVRQTARMEGVLPEDILIELIAEGVARRVFEDAQRPAPSHLMTRTGYVAPDANGNVHQPQLSHHGMQGNNRGNHNGHNNRRFNQNNRGGNHFQGRNRQNNHFKNKQRNGK